VADLPKTPAEEALRELRRLRDEARRYGELQQFALRNLEYEKPCWQLCLYPDTCLSGYIYGPSPQFRCMLRRMSHRVETDNWWKRVILGQRFEPASTGALERIRKSLYYRKTHEPYLLYLYETGNHYQQVRDEIRRTQRNDE